MLDKIDRKNKSIFQASILYDAWKCPEWKEAYSCNVKKFFLKVNQTCTEMSRIIQLQCFTPFLGRHLFFSCWITIPLNSYQNMYLSESCKQDKSDWIVISLNIWTRRIHKWLSIRSCLFYLVHVGWDVRSQLTQLFSEV